MWISDARASLQSHRSILRSGLWPTCSSPSGCAQALVCSSSLWRWSGGRQGKQRVRELMFLWGKSLQPMICYEPLFSSKLSSRDRRSRDGLNYFNRSVVAQPELAALRGLGCNVWLHAYDKVWKPLISPPAEGIWCSCRGCIKSTAHQEKWVVPKSLDSRLSFSLVWA